MKKVNKTVNNLQQAWNYLDLAYENMEKAFDILARMNTSSEEMKRYIDMFDMSLISGMKEEVEIMMEEKENNK